MPTLETYYARQPRKPFQAPRVPAWWLANTGQVAEAEALEGMGRAVSGTANIVQKWYDREGNSQFDTQRRLAREEINKFEATDFEDADTHDVAYKKLRAVIAKLAPKNTTGAREFKSWEDLMSPALDKIADEKKIRMIKFNNEKAYFRNISSIPTEKDYGRAREAAYSLTQGAIANRVRTPAQASSDYKEVMGDWLRADIWRRATANVRPDGEVDWSEAVKWFGQAENIEGVDSKVIDGLLEDAKTQESLQKRRDDDKLKIAQEEDRGNIYELINSNSEEATGAIDNSILGEKEKQSLRNLIGKNIPLNYPEYDKVVDIIDGVALGTHTKEQADQAIMDGVGKHFDTSVATSLRSKLSEKSKADSPTKRPAATRAITEIEEVMDARIAWAKAADKERKTYDFAAEQADLHTKNKLKNDFDAWMLEKDRTDEEIEKKVESLTRPVKEETVKWFDRLLEMLPVVFPLIGHKARQLRKTGPKTEAEFNRTVAEIEDEDEARKYYDKWNDKW